MFEKIYTQSELQRINDARTAIPGHRYIDTWGNIYEGTSYRRINSLAGSSAIWGNITGDITDQVDLVALFATKQDLLVSGENIKTINGISLLGSGDISITGVVASVTDDGGGVVTVDNTDPVNPVVGFAGVSVDGATIIGDGTIGNPLIAVIPVDGSGTANEITYWVDANTLGALAVATYPSLTELSYVKGVTSTLQTQLNGKLSNIVEDTSPELGGELDANAQNIIDLGDITFKTGAIGGTIRTGISAADKFELQAYDVNGGFYQKVLEVDAGNTPTLEVFSDSFAIWDTTDETKKFNFLLSGGTTGVTTTLASSPTANRTITFPNATGTLALEGITGTGLFIFLTGGNQTTTSASATAITDLITPTLEANSRYTVNGILHTGCNNTGGTFIACDVPLASTLYLELQGRTSAATAWVSQVLVTDATLHAIAFNRTNNANGSIILSGEIATGANTGTAQFMFASAVAGQTSTIYQEGSWFFIKKIA